MAIWLLNLALLGGAVLASVTGDTGPMLSAWLGWVAVSALTYPVGRRLSGTPGWLLTLLTLAASLLLFELRPEAPAWWGALASAFVVGSATGLGVHLGRTRVFVPAAALAALYLAAQSLVIAFTGYPTSWMLWVIAALAVGAAIGYMFRLVTDLDELDSIEPGKLLAAAESAMASFNLARARRLLAKAAAAAPDDLRIKRAHYAAWKFHPFSDRFHEVAAALLASSDHALVSRYYKDYLAVTQVRPRLPVALHLDLARRFAAHGDPDESARIVNLYLQRDSRTPGLPGGLLATMQGYLEVDNPSKAARYGDTLIAMYPDSSEARSARGILDNLVGGADR